MGFPPQSKDLLGVQWEPNATRRASVGSFGIPDNESILAEFWVEMPSGLDGWTGGNASYFFYLSVAGQNFRVTLYKPNQTLSFWMTDGGGTQEINLSNIAPGYHHFAFLLDRDNSLMSAWVDGTLVQSDALVRDPSLAAGSTAYWTGTGENHATNYIFYRGRMMSFANGSTPTAADLTEAFEYERHPESTIHPTLLSAVGSINSEYLFGEGVYGATTITDVGSVGGYNLTWAGGVTVEDVRVRAKTPVRKPVENLYTMTSGYTATTGAVDFGFAVQPVIARINFDKISGLGSQDIGIIDAGATDYVYLETVAGVRRLNVKGQMLNLDTDQARKGGDLWIVCSGTDCKVYLGAQHIGTLTLGSALDLSGNCVLGTDGRTHCCRVAAWNPATVPANLLDEIRACVMNPEIDPASLTNKRVDFPLNETTLPLATSTTVANAGTGGGTLTLSAQRSTSCKVMYAARA